MPAAKLIHIMPAFLQQSEEGASQLPVCTTQEKADLQTDIDRKFAGLDRQQESRFQEAANVANGLSTTPSMWSRLPRENVTTRNRYGKAEPWAQNRIHLEVAAGENDYINATAIQLGDRRYIAARGPKKNTVNHLYRMLASEAGIPTVIVMLTQTHQGKDEKCFQYFPASKSESPLAIPVDLEFQDGFQGSVVFKDLAEHQASQTQIRRLSVRTTVDNRAIQDVDILHHLFTAWPDHGVPDEKSQAALVRLIRMTASFRATARKICGDSASTVLRPSNNGYMARRNPLVVHCSAGYGRTGTFIALDYLLSLLDAGELDDVPLGRDPVFEVVENLRKQRMRMVETDVQYAFIYKVLRDEMQARKREEL